MRLLGVVLAIAGAVGVVHCVRATLEQGRPKDVAYALLTIVAALVALTGVALAFVPGFLG
ncbi:MAG: hypothetical protein GY811_08245 [Myxococcales bacterium]|nr:hypothetical protein [Myxococcales bacterium]